MKEAAFDISKEKPIGGIDTFMREHRRKSGEQIRYRNQDRSKERCLSGKQKKEEQKSNNISNAGTKEV